MKNYLPPFLFRSFGALGALTIAGSLFMLQAAATPATNAPPVPPSPSPARSGSVLITPAPLPVAPPLALTNAAPAAAAVSHGVSIEINDPDSDDDDSKAHGHSKLSDHNVSGNDFVGVALEAVLIPIIAILACFGTPVLIVFFVCYFKYRRRRENLALAQEYLAKGLPVPPQLLDESQGTVDYSATSDSPSRCKSDLRRGFSLGFIGLGVTLALFFEDPHSTSWAWGLIPMVMGIGYLISGWVEARQRANGTGARTTPPSSPGSPL